MFGVDDAIIAGAITAAGTAYAASTTNASNQQVNAMNAAQAGAMFGEGQMFAREQAHATRQFNSEQAQYARDWQERMSNTAVQRSIMDMKQAGINPMMAVAPGGGASSGSGPSASTSASGSPAGQVPGMIPMRSIGGEAATSALQATQAVAAGKKLDAETRLLENQAAAQGAMVPQSMMQTRKMEAEVENLVENRQLILQQVKQLAADTGKKYIETAVQSAMHDLIQEDIKYRAGQTELVNVQRSKMKVEQALLEYETAKGKAYSDFYASKPGQAKPYVDMGTGIVDGITGAFKRGAR